MNHTETIPTHTEQLAAILRCFDDGGDQLVIDARDLSGLGQHEHHWLTPPFDAGVPLPVIALLIENFAVRLAPVTRAAGQVLVDCPVLAVLWRPPTRFEPEEGRHVVTDEGLAAIAGALRGMPPPSVLVDSGNEIWAAWRLVKPIPWAEAPPVLAALAARLGAETTALDPLCTLPLSGPIRNWNSQAPEFTEILHADPERRYTLDQLVNQEHPAS